MFSSQRNKLTTKINNNSPSLNRQSTSRPSTESFSKPSTQRRLIKKPCQARDPFNPILHHFITRTTHPSGHPQDPVSGTLAEFRKTKKIYSSSQAMDRTIQKIINLNQPPPQPSTSKITLNHYHHPPHQSTSIPPSSSPNLEPISHSVEQAFQWTQIYIRFLKSSPNQEVFARRIKELIHRRLPKQLIEPIIRFHSTEEELVSIQSYNHLLAYYYQSERYHLARRLIKEMEERDIPKNQETQELIACSYQALNKFKGVQLTLDAIKADGHQVSHQCLTRLFSIRPRRPSKLEHFDSMDDPIPSGTDHPPNKPARTEDQSWMSIEEFLNHHRWDSENLRKDGRALVTLTKRLMELGRWKEAKEFVEIILNLDHQRSLAEKSRLAITPYWATSLLEALVFGLYNLKRQGSPEDSLETDSNRLPVDCVVQFVERFIDHHPEHLIKANSRTLLNCLRIQTFLPPSEIHRISTIWTRRYGLEPKLMGSRLGIRFLHVISAWFLRLLRSTQSLISNIDRSSSSIPESSAVEEIQENLKRLINEYLIIDEQLIECLWLNEVPRTGLSSKPGEQGKKRGEDLLIERLILNGPVDGKLIRTMYRFISTQDLRSIKSSLQKLFKIRTKIIKLMTLNLHLSSEAKLMNGPRPIDGEEDSPSDLAEFYRPVLDGDRRLSRFLSHPSHHDDNQTLSPFNQKFYSLIDRFKFHPPQDHPHQLTLDLVNKLPTPIGHPVAPAHAHAPPPRLDHHRPAIHTLVCWRSEDRHSSPIYFKPSSS